MLGSLSMGQIQSKHATVTGINTANVLFLNSCFIYYQSFNIAVRKCKRLVKNVKTLLKVCKTNVSNVQNKWAIWKMILNRMKQQSFQSFCTDLFFANLYFYFYIYFFFMYFTLTLKHYNSSWTPTQIGLCCHHVEKQMILRLIL